MSTRILSSLAVAASLVAAAPLASAATSDNKPVAAEVTSMPAAATTQVVDQGAGTDSYAARDAHDKKAQDFQGGSVVVIGVSGGALLIIIILLLLLV